MIRTTQTGKLAENLYALRTSLVNFFVYTEGGTVVAVDTGLYAPMSRRAFRRLGLDPAAVTHVLLTHSDSDHVGGLSLFPKAEIFLPAAEEQMVDGTTPRGRRHFNRPLPRAYRKLANGEELALGPCRIEAIATPGHTPGSMAYLLNRRYLITGDTLGFTKGRARPYAIGMDKQGQGASIAKLARLQGVELLCTAHSGCTNDFTAAMEGWR